MPYQAQYRSKLMSAGQAAMLVPSRCRFSMGMAVSEPPAFLRALEERIQKGEIEELRLYYMHSERAARETILKPEYSPIVKPHSFFIGKTERALPSVYYMPANFSRVPEVIAEVGIDVFAVMVSPMDKSGLFSCGTNSDYTIPTARIAQTLIVEVNPNMPRVFGDSFLHISEVDAIIESQDPLPEIPARPVTEWDRRICRHLIALIPDRATLQVGIGGVPNAVCEALTSHKGLGVHTEMIGPGLAALMQSGAVTNKYKNINRYKNVYTFAQGDRAMYDFLNDNASMELQPVSYVNNPLVIAQNDQVISINGFLQIDLSGQVNAESIGGKQYSAPGGQLDFIRGAQCSKNGKSILAAYSTAENERFSRIVTRLDGPVTDPRVDIQYVATEYGVVNLQGKSVTERALALIEIAHPKFRESLLCEAKAAGYIR